MHANIQLAEVGMKRTHITLIWLAGACPKRGLEEPTVRNFMPQDSADKKNSQKSPRRNNIYKPHNRKLGWIRLRLTDCTNHSCAPIQRGDV